jgi:hypothetical protein
MQDIKNFLIKEYQEKGSICIPQQIIGKIGGASLLLLVELFYEKYLKIQINPEPKEKRKYHCINKLVKSGFIKKEKKKDIYKIKDLITVNHKKQYKERENFILNDNCCQWCNIETIIIHKHHFPIPKSKGGIDTVNICPNCHYSFHSLTDEEHLELTDKTINIFLNLCITQ